MMIEAFKSRMSTTALLVIGAVLLTALGCGRTPPTPTVPTPTVKPQSTAIKTYYPTGELESYQEQVGGVKQGWLVVFWSTKDSWTSGSQIMAAVHYDHDKISGSVFRWSDTGNLVGAATFKDDQPVDGWVVFDPVSPKAILTSAKMRSVLVPIWHAQYRNGGMVRGPEQVQSYAYFTDTVEQSPELKADMAHVKGLAAALRP
jgi:hypothetical protein